MRKRGINIKAKSGENLSPEEAKRKQVRKELKPYANFYVKNKAELIPMMEKASNGAIDPDATHGELIRLYIQLMRENPDFKEQVQNKINAHRNAVDPVSAIAEAIGQVAGTVGTFKEGANIKAGAEAKEEAMLYAMVLEGQKDHTTRNILIISGVSLLVVGGLIYLVKRKK